MSKNKRSLSKRPNGCILDGQCVFGRKKYGPKQGFPYMAEYLNWPNFNWTNGRGPSGPSIAPTRSYPFGPNCPSGIRHPRSGRLRHPLRQPIRPFLISAISFFIYIYSCIFIYFSIKFGHSRNLANKDIRPIEIRILPL